MNILYKTKAVSTGGRTGQSATEDGRLSVNLSTPKELGGAGGEGTNPEQLFAAGYSACFLSALQLVSKMSGQELPAGTSVAATVGLGKDGEKLGLDVDMEVTIPGFDAATAEQLVQATHGVCPYSLATKGNIDVRLKVSV